MVGVCPLWSVKAPYLAEPIARHPGTAATSSVDVVSCLSLVSLLPYVIPPRFPTACNSNKTFNFIYSYRLGEGGGRIRKKKKTKG